METTSFATLARRFFNNQVRNSRKGGKTMKKLLRGLTALTVASGITVAAQAATITPHWVTVNPQDIEGISLRTNSSGLVTYTDKTGCGGREIRISTTDPRHNRAFILFTTAHTTKQEIFIMANSCNNDGSANAGQVNMYQP